jgi:hypothetical protein
VVLGQGVVLRCSGNRRDKPVARGKQRHRLLLHRYCGGQPRTVNYHDLGRDRTEIFEDGQYSTELFAREAAQFVRDNRANPFFLYVPFNGVHYPMHAPKKYAGRFPELEPERRMYGAMLSAVDDGVGLVMRTLREHRLTENALVFFSADNGATRESRAGLHQKPATAANNWPFRGNKFSAFDGGMHVPMVMSFLLCVRTTARRRLHRHGKARLEGAWARDRGRERRSCNGHGRLWHPRRRQAGCGG